MSAHPMITPLTAVSPHAVAADYPSDAAALYQMLWDTTLAHVKGPSTVLRTRLVFGTRAHPVALDWIQAETGGWLDVLPAATHRAASLPVNLGVPANAVPLRDSNYSIVPVESPGLGRGVDAFLQWLDELQVVSPGRLGSIIDEMIQAGWVSEEQGALVVTESGNAQVRGAEIAGFEMITGHTLARWRLACDGYADESHSLDELVAQTYQLLGVDVSAAAAELDLLISHGHSANEAYALRDQEAIRPSVSASFPRAMDPETLLRSDDPLRRRRMDMESELAAGLEQRWRSLSGSERSAIRLGHLASELSVEASHRLAEDLHFDTRLRWLVGLGSEAIPPELETSLQSFNSWKSLAARALNQDGCPRTMR